VFAGAESIRRRRPKPTPEELEAAALTELDEKQPESNQTPALMEPKKVKRPRRARLRERRGAPRRRWRRTAPRRRALDGAQEPAASAGE